MRINMSEMLDKAERGKISDAELKEVVYRINNLTDKPNLEVLLAILGETRKFEYKSVLEKFLVYPDDPMISRSVAIILFQDWGMADQYLPYIKEMMKGASWDCDEQVRLIALSVGGQLFRDIKDKEFLKILLDVFENKEVDMITRGCAYREIAECVGVLPQNLPRLGVFSKHLEKRVDKNVLARAYQLLNEKN